MENEIKTYCWACGTVENEEGCTNTQCRECPNYEGGA
jgi:hypothetical protein